MPEILYTIPRIYRGQKEWFIDFYYRHKPGEPKSRYRLRMGLNYIKNISERERQAVIYRKELEYALKAGKVPIPQYKGDQMPFVPENAQLTILPAAQPAILPTPEPAIQALQQQMHILIEQNKLMQAQLIAQATQRSADMPALISSPTAASQIKLIDRLTDISISEGKGKSAETKRSYQLYINRLSWFIEHIGRPDMTLEEFIDDRAQEFKEYMIEELV